MWDRADDHESGRWRVNLDQHVDRAVSALEGGALGRKASNQLAGMLGDVPVERAFLFVEATDRRCVVLRKEESLRTGRRSGEHGRQGDELLGVERPDGRRRRGVASFVGSRRLDRLDEDLDLATQESPTAQASSSVTP